MPEGLFGIRVSGMGGAGVSGARKGEKAKFEQGLP